jgi:hypothetical protein
MIGKENTVFNEALIRLKQREKNELKDKFFDYLNNKLIQYLIRELSEYSKKHQDF